MMGIVRSRWLQALAALAFLAGLVACGGGVGSGGTGSPSVTLGTVTGFGSIVVDGVRFDDRDARIEAEDRPGLSPLTEARLGHRIEVEFESEGVAQRVRVEAELRGFVSELVAGGFKVLQQTVLVNADPAFGPVTQFGDGYTTLTDVAVGHVVEVHGVPRKQGGDYVIQATRIDRKAALLATAFVRVTGLVSDLRSTSFKLGELTVEYNLADIVPAGRTLANGQRVVVLARPAHAAVSTLAAGQVRIKERVNGPVAADVAGVVSALNTGAGRFDLGGIPVNYAGAQVDPAGALADGRYVRVRGRFAADGSFVASRVQVRKLDGEPEFELKGTVVDFDSATQRFTVRGVTVSAAGARLSDCPGSGLADGLFVEVKGNLGATGVVATEVKCEDAAQGAVVEREGSASGVSEADKSFTLTPAGGGAVTVRWTVLTYFRDGLTPASLAGQSVEVEGVLVGDVLVARKIKPD